MRTLLPTLARAAHFRVDTPAARPCRSGLCLRRPVEQPADEKSTFDTFVIGASKPGSPTRPPPQLAVGRGNRPARTARCSLGRVRAGQTTCFPPSGTRAAVPRPRHAVSLPPRGVHHDFINSPAGDGPQGCVQRRRYTLGRFRLCCWWTTPVLEAAVRPGGVLSHFNTCTREP